MTNSQNNRQAGGNFSDAERGKQHVEAETTTMSSAEEQMLLDYLLVQGFSQEEGTRLMYMRENLYENAEMRQRVTDDCRMHFARWLYEQGEMNEE